MSKNKISFCKKNVFCPALSIPYGQISVLGQGYVPGSPIPNYSLVRITCDQTFALYPPKNMIGCVDGIWNMEIPQCKLTCRSRTSNSVDVTCRLNGQEVDCSQPLVEGTIATSKCKDYYTKKANEIPISTCSGGSWDRPLIRCDPECGEPVSDGTTHIINSFSAKMGKFPWHIALYRFENGKHEYKCGGSIITPLIVITTAHCFTDETGMKFPAEEYFVGAGKYYSDFNSIEDKFAQIRQIREYFIPVEYRAAQSSYAGDIALAVVKKAFQMSNLVRPVCIDWDNKIEPQQLTFNNQGSVVGWGFSDPNNPSVSAELKQLNAPYIDLGQCLQSVPQIFQRWITPDKFCAGFTNGSSVCRGDSGGGLVFEWTENNRQKFYIRGLVSVGPLKDGMCDNFQYGVYTKVSFYNDFILGIIAKNYEQVTCPPRISSSVDVTCRVDGEEVDCTQPLVEGTVATSKCKLLYTQTGNENPISTCFGKSWDNPLISCVAECAYGYNEDPSICKRQPTSPDPTPMPSLTTGTCPAISVKNGQATTAIVGHMPGSPVPNNGIVVITCNEEFSPFPSNNLIVCMNGNWNVAVPQCYYCDMTFGYFLHKRQIKTENGSCPALSIAYGQISVLGQGYVPGSPIPNYALVKITCDKTFALYPPKDVIGCVDGNWNMEVPQCKLTCRPRISSSVDVKCSVIGKEVDCSQLLVDGTVATSKCKDFYTKKANEIPISTCSGGSWDRPLIRCDPECGETISDGTTHIINSFSAKMGKFPWHIALYRFENGKHEYKCGGSIITPLIVITTAHCFTDEIGKKFPAGEYFVGAGKYYSDYNSVEDKFAQTRQIKEYYIPLEYRAAQSNFAGDIAVAVMEKPFQLSNVVRPVCIDWDNKIEPQQLTVNNQGSVVGWGFVDPSQPVLSAELKQLNAPYVDLGQCLQTVPQNFLRWITLDKFCAGFTNGSSVCRGDSGGGLVFGWKEHNRQKFYIRGLVSVGPLKNGRCDNFQYGVYTKISFYNNFILEVIAKNHEQVTCPPRISSSVDVTCRVDGEEVDCTQPLVEGTVATSKCKLLYTQTGNGNPISTCFERSWNNPLIQCEPECADGSDIDPSICKRPTTSQDPTPMPPLTNGACPAISIRNGQTKLAIQGHVPGSPIPNYSVVSIICNEDFTPFPASNKIICMNGNWNMAIPQCYWAPRVLDAVI